MSFEVNNNSFVGMWNIIILGSDNKNTNKDNAVDSSNDNSPALRVLFTFELLTKIFEYAGEGNERESLRNFFSFRSVCKRWNDVANDSILRPLCSKVTSFVCNNSLFKEEFAKIMTDSMESKKTYFERLKFFSESLNQLSGIKNYNLVRVLPSNYQKMDADLRGALEIIWGQISGFISFEEAERKPSTAEEIRSWLNDPQNSERIERITGLNLFNSGLKILPSEIGKFKNLIILDLSNNQLSAIPEEIGNLKNLLGLFLHDNELTTLPVQICNLNKLLWLIIENNRLTILPDDIGNLTNLTSFDLNNNKLATLPASIVELRSNTLIRLDNNPFLFALNKDFSGYAQNLQNCLTRYMCCSEYECQTPLASFCHSILFNTNEELLNEQFCALPEEARDVILGKVNQLRMQQNPSIPLRYLFALAIMEFLKQGFSEISEEQKNLVYDHVKNIAGYEAEERSWGEDHAEENILRLIDAFALATQPNGRKFRRYH